MRQVNDRGVVDRAQLDEALATFAPEQLGRSQALTPKGFLLCSGVRIARTGPMMYRHDEVPEVTPGSNGEMIVVLRDAETLFSPETIASFSGMDVTNDHPDSLITPKSPRGLAVGTVLNPRRGEGLDADHLVADLLIKDAKAIKDVQDRKKREVSCGYDADVEEIKPGLGRQTKIIGNHVAIVDRGRAGPTCAIQDKEPEPMALTRKKFFDRLKKAFKDQDEEELNRTLAAAPEMSDEDEGEGEGRDVHVHIHQGGEPAPAAAATDKKDEADPYEARFKSIEDSVGALCSKFDEAFPPKKEGDEGKTTDAESEEEKEEKAEATSDARMDAIAKAEIILPGHKAGTMDSATGATLTGLRRDVLTRAFADSARKANVEAVVGASPDFAKMSPRQLRATFDGVAAVARQANTRTTIRPADMPQGRMTAAKLQEQIEARRKRA